MRTVRFLTLALAGFMCMQASAKTEADSCRFNGHWFISAHGGVQYTLGEAKFGDLLSPTVQLAGGYQFNPWLAARLSVGAWQSKGGFSGYVVGGRATNTTYKYNYVAPTIDVMFNLSNIFCGYNPNRVFNLGVFVGGGVNVGFGNDEANDLNAAGYNMRYIWSGTQVLAVGRGGLDLDFRVSDRVSIGLEGSANILSDKYNSKKAGNPDWYFNVMAGVKINLGKTKKKVAAPAPAPAPAPVVESQPETVQPAKPEPKPEPKEIRRDVFFKINSTKVEDAEMTKIKDLAQFLKDHSDAVVEITGYADAGTGTKAINARLSAGRAESVKKVLVNQYNIDPARIHTSSKGDTVQPFSTNDMNRVSICVVAR